MKEILATDRLRLREFNLGDADFIITLLNSKGWLQFIGDRNVRTKEDAIGYLENGPLKSYALRGYGLSMVERKIDGTAIGMCGILHRPNLDCPDIGFAFLPEYGGQGYAFEIASATLAYATNTLHLPKIAAITQPNNDKSIRLLEKAGFIFVKSFTYPESIQELLLFEK